MTTSCFLYAYTYTNMYTIHPAEADRSEGRGRRIHWFLIVRMTSGVKQLREFAHSRRIHWFLIVRMTSRGEGGSGEKKTRKTKTGRKFPVTDPLSFAHPGKKYAVRANPSLRPGPCLGIPVNLYTSTITPPET